MRCDHPIKERRPRKSPVNASSEVIQLLTLILELASFPANRFREKKVFRTKRRSTPSQCQSGITFRFRHCFFKSPISFSKYLTRRRTLIRDICSKKREVYNYKIILSLFKKLWAKFTKFLIILIVFATFRYSHYQVFKRRKL